MNDAIRVGRYTDADLLDALERYAWRVWQDDRGQPAGWRIKVDLVGGAQVGEGATVREALTAALESVSNSAETSGS